MLSFKNVQGHLVIATAEGAIVGRIDDFQFDLESHEVYGYRLKGMGMFARAGGVSAAEMSFIGREVSFVGAEEQVDWSGAGRNVEPGRAWASQYRGTRAMSRTGSFVGAIEDLVFEINPDRLVGLILDGGRFLPLSDGVATGPAAVIMGGNTQLEALPAEGSSSEAEWVSWIRKAVQKRPASEPDVSEE